MRISDWSSDVFSSDLLLFTTVGFVAHWRQQPCFAASFAPIWTSAAILAADPHLWLRQYLQEVGTWSGKTNFDHLPGHGEYFGNRLQIGAQARSEEYTSELQSLMRISYAVFCLEKKKPQDTL